VAGFTFASLVNGIAGNSATLIGSRFVQGTMAALMVPQVMALMQVMYKPEERSRINALFGILGGVAASLGPIIGGILLKINLFQWDWRPIFLINVPVGILGLLAAAKFLPQGKSPHPLKLDLAGTAIIMVALGLLVFPLIQGRELGWPAWSFAMLIASVPAFLLFIWWQRKKDAKDHSPLILPSLLGKRSFSAGLMVNLSFMSAMIGLTLGITLLLQIGLGYTPLHAALTNLPTPVGIMMSMAIFGRALPQLGRRGMLIGNGVMALGIIITVGALYYFGLDIHSWQLFPGFFIMGIGMGFVFGSLLAAVLSNVDPADAGSASGALQAVQQIGAATGIALVGVVLFGQLSSGATASFESVKPELQHALTQAQVPGQVQPHIIDGFHQCFIDRAREKDPSIIPASCKQGKNASPEVNQVIADAARQATFYDFRSAFRWAAGLGVALLGVSVSLTFLLPKRFRAEAYQST